MDTVGNIYLITMVNVNLNKVIKIGTMIIQIEKLMNTNLYCIYSELYDKRIKIK